MVIESIICNNNNNNNGDSCLEVIIDYRGKTVETAVIGTILLVLPW